jgi:nucleoside-diphosphate-sugar epimerase
MRILITGGTGLVGRNLIPILIQQSFQILELTRDVEKSFSLFGHNTTKQLITEDQQEMVMVITNFKPDIVIHLASFLTSGDTYEDLKKLIESNLFFLGRILDSLKNTPPKLFINTGTFAEYYKGDGNEEPAYLYAATKTASRSLVEYYSNAYHFSYATVVPYTIYGGSDNQKKIIDLIYDSLDNNNSLNLSPGEQILDFIHIDDVVDFYYTLILNYSKVPPKSLFYLGTGKGHNLREVAALFEELEGKNCNINWGGKQYRQSDVMYAVADTSAQLHLFNWKTKVSLKQGLQFYLENKNMSSKNNYLQ